MSYHIKINAFGKIKYFSHIDGLHSGHGKKKGFEGFENEKQAKKRIKELKKIFHSGFIYEVIPESKLPFIAKQIKKRARKSKSNLDSEFNSMTYTNSYNKW